jgi:hypothetical protein
MSITGVHVLWLLARGYTLTRHVDLSGDSWVIASQKCSQQVARLHRKGYIQALDGSGLVAASLGEAVRATITAAGRAYLAAQRKR